MVARCIVGLYRPTAGNIVFDGIDLGRLRQRRAMAPVRRRMQMIFQDPYASLNPRWRVRKIVAEPLVTHGLVADRAELRARVGELLEQVRLSAANGDKFPHEFSGGQRQRISIARALAAHPEFLIGDEPTSALDVSVQAQILNLMKDLQRRLGLTYLFISHNLAVIYQISDRLGVMYLGRAWAVSGAPRTHALRQIGTEPVRAHRGSREATVAGRSRRLFRQARLCRRLSGLPRPLSFGRPFHKIPERGR